MKTIYPIAIEAGTDATAFGVVVPDLAGCFSAGDTALEAFANAREAIEAWVSATLEDDQAIPEPSALERWAAEPEFAGWTWGYVEVDLSRYQGPAERINVTFAKRVLASIDTFIAGTGESRSAFLARAASKEIAFRAQQKWDTPSNHFRSK